MAATKVTRTCTECPNTFQVYPNSVLIQCRGCRQTAKLEQESAKSGPEDKTVYSPRFNGVRYYDLEGT
jgi:hypothetical protein